MFGALNILDALRPFDVSFGSLAQRVSVPFSISDGAGGFIPYYISDGQGGFQPYHIRYSAVQS